MASDHDEQVPGVRFELRLRSTEEHAATYAVSLSAQGSEWNGEVDLVPPGGEVAFRFSGDEPPAACLSIVRAALRTVYREHEGAGFPRRLTRWRPLPGVASEKHG